jgi:hypothetical protein
MTLCLFNEEFNRWELSSTGVHVRIPYGGKEERIQYNILPGFRSPSEVSSM